MAYPDIVSMISDWLGTEKGYTIQQKQQLLEDFTNEFGYPPLNDEGNPLPVTRKQYANHIYFLKTKQAVEAYRKRQAQQAIEVSEIDITEQSGTT